MSSKLLFFMVTNCFNLPGFLVDTGTHRSTYATPGSVFDIPNSSRNDDSVVGSVSVYHLNQ